MSDRYSRQIAYENIGKTGQEKISKSVIAIIGVGALGSVSSELLTRAGVKKLILFDDDKIDITNLQRQALYTEEDVGKSKVISLKKHLNEINSDVEINAIEEKITKENISKIKADIILDGTDNMETRFLLNEYSRKTNIPYVYGAAAGSIGTVYAVTEKTPCINCIFKNAKGFLTCNNIGIINSLTYTVASMQVVLVLKIIIGEEIPNELTRFDLWKNSFETIKIKKDDSCDVCNNKKSEDSRFTIQECKTKASYTCKPNKKTRLDIKKIVKNFDVVEDAGIICVLKINGEEVIVHDYGELIFKTLKETSKIKEIAEKIYKFQILR